MKTKNGLTSTHQDEAPHASAKFAEEKGEGMRAVHLMLSKTDGDKEPRIVSILNYSKPACLYAAPASIIQELESRSEEISRKSTITNQNILLPHPIHCFCPTPEPKLNRKAVKGTVSFNHTSLYKIVITIANRNIIFYL